MTRRALDSNADVLRRLLLLQRLPLFAALSPGVLYDLAERCREGSVTAGQVITAPRGRLLFFPDGARRVSRGGVVDGADLHAPYLPNLGPHPMTDDVMAPVAGAVLEIETSSFLAAVDEDFSIFLAVASALAEASIAAVRSRRQSDLGAGLAVADETGSAGRLDLIERVLALREALPFGRERVLSLVQFARHATEVRADDGLELWRQGDLAENAFIVVQGRMRALIDGREAFCLVRGDVLSLSDVLTTRTRWYTSIAAGPLLALSIPAERFIDVLEDQPELSREVLRALALGPTGAR